MELKGSPSPSNHPEVWVPGNKKVMSFLFHIHGNATAKLMHKEIFDKIINHLSLCITINKLFLLI